MVSLTSQKIYHEKLISLNLSRNVMTKESLISSLKLIEMPNLKHFYLFGNHIEEYKDENQPSVLNEISHALSLSFPQLFELSLHGNPCID